MRTFVLASGLVVGVGLVAAAFVVGCESATCEEAHRCGDTASSDGGGDSSSGDGGGQDAPVDAPEGCDPAADPKDAPKCVVSEYGAFVDASGGDDGNPGTKDKPVKSIGAAIAKAGNKPRVYVCEGTYEEHVKVTSALSLFGGFSCGSWSYSGGKAKVAPKDKGYALELRGASSPVVVADLAFTARDGVDAGESSVGAFVVSSSKVTFRRSSIEAGKAVGGSDGSDVADFAAPAPPGNDGGGATMGAAKSNPDCPTSIGGAGGKDGTPNGANGVVAIMPAYPTGFTGAGGPMGAACFALDGSYGNAGGAGAGAASLGSLDANGWKGTDGAAGGKGGDGQGGGGGGQKAVGGGGFGGSGGPGGCGGSGGPKGTAGGSSIALLVFESSVALDQSTLTAKDAGKGGNGAKGQKGQLASTTNAAPSNGADACVGGLGGVGGSGGGGGGGVGGLSVGILYKGGSAPKVDGSEKSSADQLSGITTGKAGVAGTKGAGGDAAKITGSPSRAGLEGTDGKAGDAKAVMSAP